LYEYSKIREGNERRKEGEDSAEQLSVYNKNIIG
jgi:hypothetical protein